MRGLAPGLTDQSVASASVEDTAEQIHEQTSAILAFSSTGGTLTSTDAEQTLYIDNEPLGCWKPLTLFVDLDAMQAGDTIEIRTYYRISDAGGLQLQDYNSYTGADGGLADGRKLTAIDLKPNRHGFRLTLVRTAGSDRAYSWELFMEV